MDTLLGASSLVANGLLAGALAAYYRKWQRAVRAHKEFMDKLPAGEGAGDALDNATNQPLDDFLDSALDGDSAGGQ